MEGGWPKNDFFFDEGGGEGGKAKHNFFLQGGEGVADLQKSVFTTIVGKFVS